MASVPAPRWAVLAVALLFVLSAVFHATLLKSGRSAAACAREIRTWEALATKLVLERDTYKSNLDETHLVLLEAKRAAVETELLRLEKKNLQKALNLTNVNSLKVPPVEKYDKAQKRAAVPPPKHKSKARPSRVVVKEVPGRLRAGLQAAAHAAQAQGEDSWRDFQLRLKEKQGRPDRDAIRVPVVRIDAQTAKREAARLIENWKGPIHFRHVHQPPEPSD
eukprot:jgi/Mesvir1/21511/Mv03954-RA.1